MSSPSLRELFYQKKFLFTFELVPGRSVRTRHYQEILKFLNISPKFGYFEAFSITDNAGGHPALSPIPLGRTIKDLGLEAIVHFSCKDKNRNQLESELLALDREGLHNLLVLTGDYPFYGYQGKAKPVFDLDSVQLLQMITQMERGIELPKEAPGGGVKLPAIPFFKGAVVNPFKLTLSEIWWQYLKLYKKLKAGAYFIITQVGFAPKKWMELKHLLDVGITYIFSKFLEREEIHVKDEDDIFREIPLLGSVLYLTPSLVKAILRGKIPGILITKEVLRKFEKRDPWEEVSLEICAQLSAILKGLGFRGVHLCGMPLDYELLSRFLDKFYLYESRWEEYLSEFEEAIVKIELPNGTLMRELPCLLKNGLDLNYRGRKRPFFYLNEIIHRLFFDQKSPLFPLTKRILEVIEKNRSLREIFTRLEYFIKRLLFNCQECGDCTLWEFNYSCPQSECAKYLLNGPCGGSIGGYCEVYPFQKKCHFVAAFERAPKKEDIYKFFRPGGDFILKPRNWALYKSSSWLNFYFGRDHHSP
ncbi:MAG: methylenetetrahydrofolate reductase C-terminal domain-containing protein [Caldimicrobium sp.]|nr:methylenetetrahydrofolate reductase C-terminal domain-containing protein [Caldimicrobium sp.]MCX7873597.1 methylenetetrahydrofolate reductase C-terminal domain-containing protein [Caldimicrobium sp.]MDW8094974.1 methylenetetrahydrofolate reductase C-terminal domain-containing protein [Caldimicrobium sp.]